MSEQVDQHLITTAQRPDTVFVQGHGSWMVDSEGKRYLDAVQGWAVNSLGHCHPVVVHALAAQSQRLICASPAFYNQPQLDLAALLVQHTGMDRVFLASSGAEANEGAVKLARRWGQSHKGCAFEVITVANAFHGRTLAMMSASGKPGWDHIFQPMPSGFAKAQFNDLASVERAVNAHTVAIMVEPVQGEAGVNVADAHFLQGLRALADEQGLLLIFDEVQTGVGRCGTALAWQHFGVKPDVLTLAKGLGSGVPLAALLCQERFNCFKPGDQGGTYVGNPLMAAVGSAVLRTVCEPAFLVQVQQRARQLQAGLLQLAQEFSLPGERGLGLLRALALATPVAHEVVNAARALQPTGLLINAPRPDVLRFMPALNISEADMDEALRLLRLGLRAVLS